MQLYRWIFGAGFSACVLASFAAHGAPDSSAVEKTRDVRVCPTEPPPGDRIQDMAGNGWDGAGQNAATITFHFDGATADSGATAQRQAIFEALQAWADVVDITFVERPVSNRTVSIDFDFLRGDHSAAEPQEAGDSDCPFDGAGGTLAHAGFPPGVGSLCTNTLAETFAGNVHFDDDENWEFDNEDSSAAFSLKLIACHEIGHAIGLTHTSGSGDVMRPTFGPLDAFAGLSATDIDHIRSGYRTGVGQVLPLENTGVWVDGTFGGPEEGTAFSPFDTIAEGVAGVPPASTSVPVIIRAGTYAEALVITRPMRLVATNGTVLIDP